MRQFLLHDVHAKDMRAWLINLYVNSASHRQRRSMGNWKHSSGYLVSVGLRRVHKPQRALIKLTANNNPVPFNAIIHTALKPSLNDERKLKS
jgi:hypothetical protein